MIVGQEAQDLVSIRMLTLAFPSILMLTFSMKNKDTGIFLFLTTTVYEAPAIHGLFTGYFC